MPTSRNLIIPKVVKAIRNMDAATNERTYSNNLVPQDASNQRSLVSMMMGSAATKPEASGRSATDHEAASAASARSKSSSDTRRLSITVKKRLMPMDILTDAKANTTRTTEQLTDRSSARNHHAA